jgi:predicted SAM-dependent methyltransferase
MKTVRATAKFVLASLNRPVGEWRLKRLVADQGPTFDVEIGGRGRRAGWVVTNIGWDAPFYLDATRSWPFKPGTVRHLYSDNMIEHLTLDQCRSVLKHARAAMAPGGTIRLTTPDVESIARLYLSDDRADVDRMMHWHKNEGRLAEHPADLLRIYFTSWGHESGYLYDFSSLDSELRRAGFGDVRRCATSESDNPALRGLENRLDAEQEMQLVVEADACPV